MKILFIKEKRSYSGIEGVAIYLHSLCKYLDKIKVPYLILYNNSNDMFIELLKKDNLNYRIVNFPQSTAYNLLNFNIYNDIKNQIKSLIVKEKITHNIGIASCR